MKLTAENVNTILLDLLYKEGESMEENPPVMVEGIMRNFGFHPVRLEAYKQDIMMMLEELPDDFKTSGGGGMSFLNLCMTRDGEHWGEHPSMEVLACLGVASGQAQWAIPRRLWSALPGGMPYLTVLDKK